MGGSGLEQGARQSNLKVEPARWVTGVQLCPEVSWVSGRTGAAGMGLGREAPGTLRRPLGRRCQHVLSSVWCICGAR